MEFVALISGGKDSCYNIYKCLQYGHQLKCLANLQSPTDAEENEELHSFMYQTAGSSVISAYEECLGFPLIRRKIQGKALTQSLSYENVVEGDEVEDLYELLKEVKERFPSIRGVSCGAIVSNYQRIRVENICNRLGLISLSYLWQKDRKELIYELCSSSTGVEAVIIKVAGAGLIPEKHLGKSLRELLPTLDRLHQKYGLDYCGEGGEYESLVLDAPFFLKRIEILKSRIIYDEEDKSVGMLKITEWRLCDKEEPKQTELIQKEKEVKTGNVSGNSKESGVFPVPEQQSDFHYFPPIHLNSSGFGQTGIIYPTTLSTTLTDGDVTTQVKEVMTSLFSLLQYYDINPLDAIFIHLYISNISFFSIVNAEYCKWFSQYPPSRCCVEVSIFLSSFFCGFFFLVLFVYRCHYHLECKLVCIVLSLKIVIQ
jgi:diphthine-ammonia ligase